MIDNESPLEKLAALSTTERERVLAAEARKHGMTPAALKAMLLRSWRFVGRPKQQPPAGDWVFWWLLAGRGFGKTLSAAQWTKTRLLERRVRWALVAPTFRDGRDTMVEGETGLLSVIPTEALLGQSRDHAWNRSLGELRLANGSIAKVFSSETPDALRGPQHDGAWCEEVSSWRDAGKPALAENTTWSNVLFSTRLSERPQIALTSTPKANRLTRDLLKTPHMIVVRGSSYENRANLSEVWWNLVIAPLEGTRLGRQEIQAEVLEDVEGALWRRALLDLTRVRQGDVPDLYRIVVGVDPNASSDEAANSAGIVVAGVTPHRDAFGRQHGYVLDDRTVVRGGPRAWARAAVDAYHDWNADLIVAEKNNGGEMVEITIHAVDRSVPVKLVTASRGKRTRAEPIATLYEGDENWERDPHVRQPSVHHAGVFPELEDEMTTWTPESDSPDRMDALVWALTELLQDPASGEYVSSVARGTISTSVLDRRVASEDVLTRRY